MVSLSSNNALLSVPASVMVPAGSSSANFTATAGTITADQSAVVTATLSGSSMGVTLSLVASPTSGISTYYFPHFAIGGGWQTVLTYVNYSQQAVTCQTNFVFDDGTPLAVPFGGPASPARSDTLAPGGSIHLLSTADPNAVGGWAQGQCTGPVKASMLFRWYNQGAAITEAGVNATTTPANRFVTYAESFTGIAYANPQTQSANLTVTVYNAAGSVVGTPHNVTLPPGGHRAENIFTWLGQSFTGSVQITSDVPIVSLSLNAEASTPAHLVVSSLSPGEVGGSGATTYYFPHFAVGGGWQTVLTYVNYSSQSVTCTTNFFADDGTPLPVAFGGAASATRTDTLLAGGSIHSLSTADALATGGWAQAVCSGPVKASMLFRWYNQGAVTEAGVNASTTPTTKFATYAQTQTGVAFANTSSTQSAFVTILVLDAMGNVLSTKPVTVPRGGHQAYNIYEWFNQNFTGSMQIVSTVPIVSLALNFEASSPPYLDLVTSSLPPGDLDSSTLLSTGH
jgi:hypothetical protein